MVTRIRQFAQVLFLTLLTLSLHSCALTNSTEEWEDVVPHSGQSLLDQLSRQEIVEMTLTANLDSLINNRRTESYSPGSLSFRNERGKEQNWQLQIKPRGKYRRKICDFPPLKLKLSKDQLTAAGLEPYNEFKLVTHCLDDERVSRDLILKEYLAYKLYNELTPYSLRAQLVKITYQDSARPGYRITNWGFLLEDKEELTDRIKMEPCKNCMGQPAENFAASHEKIASLFEYMIGNTDWSFEMARNVEMMKNKDGKIVPIPYDFDFSVFVSAPYMRPNTEVKQSPKMERVFMGYSATTKDLYSTMSYFNTKREALTGIIYEFRLLDEDTRLGLLGYLDSFYQQIESEEALGKALFANDK